jgi:Na+-driven multidrug efflux pump
VAVGISMSNYMVIEKNKKISLYATLIAGIVNFLLNLYFIKKFGIIDAAWTTVIPQETSSYIFYFFLKDKSHIRMRTKTFNLFRVIKLLKDFNWREK